MKIGNLIFEGVELLNEANVFNIKIDYNEVSLQGYLKQFEDGLNTPDDRDWETLVIWMYAVILYL